MQIVFDVEYITSSGRSIAATEFSWPADCSCKYTENNSRIQEDILDIDQEEYSKCKKKNSKRNTPWSISFCLLMPWFYILKTWHHSQKKHIFLSRRKTPRFLKFSQINLYWTLLGAPAHPFALRALHGSPLPCIRNTPVESLAATGRGFLGLAKRKIE